VKDPTDDLYGLPQAEFTAARDAAVKEARAAGDKELAARIAKLRKPNAVAWLANQLARHRRPALDQLVDLGEQLRAATSGLDGDKLRRLSTRQHQMIADVVREAHTLADRPIADATERGLEETLRSAMVDPEAAEQLRAGRLAEGLSRVGFTGLLGTIPEDASPKPAARAPHSSTKDVASEKLRKAAEAARDEAAADLAAAEEAVRAARRRVDDLKQELDEAYEERAEADRRVQAARKRAQKADRNARLAARGLSDVSSAR